MEIRRYSIKETAYYLIRKKLPEGIVQHCYYNKYYFFHGDLHHNGRTGRGKDVSLLLSSEG